MNGYIMMEMTDQAPIEERGFPMAKSGRLLLTTIGMVLLALSGGLAQEEGQPPQVTDYKIGPNDLLEITVFGLPELAQTVRVAEDGSITMPLLGKVEVAGLTAQELEKKLATILDQQYTKEARVTVFIREYQKVSVLGAVGRPGQYELVGPTTLLQVIAQAGGLTAQAMNELFVYRRAKDGQQTTITILVEELMIKGNIELRPKDIISVPLDRTQNVFVYGEVHSPGAVPYLASKRITVLQAIAQAGGTTEWAKKSRVVIKRKDRATGKEMKIRVNLKKLVGGSLADIFLEEGDVVIVP
jgi:polysaccharide export outer membrane protein